MTLNVTILDPASGGTIAADNSTPLTLTATVTASEGESVDAIAVNWQIDNTGGSGAGAGDVNPATSNTDTSGIATAALTASAAGDIAVRAYTDDDTNAGGMVVTINATAVSGGTIVSECVTSLPAIPNDESLPSVITATVLDSSSAPASGVDVTWTVSEGSSPDVTTSTTDENGQAKVSVTTTSANNSLVSVQATTADDATGQTAFVIAKSPTTPAPVVTNAGIQDDYTLDYYDIEFGVEAEVPRYIGASPGDNVTFFWGEYSLQFIVQDPVTDLPRVVNASEDLPEDALADGLHPVYYQVLDSNGNPSISTALPINVVNGGQTVPSLPLPQVPDADDGSINIIDSLTGVIVHIAYNDMAEGDSIALYWLGMQNNGQNIPAASTSYQLAAAAGDTFVEQVIEQKWFYPFDGQGYEGSAQVYYTVQRADGSPLALSQTRDIIVDTVSS